jgi:hypothetical protein
MRCRSAEQCGGSAVEIVIWVCASVRARICSFDPTAMILSGLYGESFGDGVLRVDGSVDQHRVGFC